MKVEWIMDSGSGRAARIEGFGDARNSTAA
jgi:hypothetical protein